ncbi:MAG: T9SS type A sorting domain-containing protein [Bacteroidales bacterium]|jgi:hypothetical protein|nr:T9SS type A sorting domain-containing protein [Bacteroidales bacterium]
MRKITLFLLATAFVNISFCQLSISGKPRINSQIKALVSANINIEKPDLTEAIKYDNNPDNFYKMRRFGVIIPTEINFFNEAESFDVKEGKLWILKIKSDDAQALSLYFDNFFIPQGGELFIYDNNQEQILGKYTSINNNEQGTFATELLYGDNLIMEYFQPNDVKQEANMNINKLGYAYRDCEKNYKIGFNTSGSCNVNVNCSEGDDYRDEQRGVVKIQITTYYSMGFCSGTLINNTQNDLTPYILSAAHCVADVTANNYNDFIFYFNYEASGCSQTTEPTPKTLLGSSLKAKGDYSDFLLMELKDSVPYSYNAYWNGWKKDDVASSSGVAIHHPGGDIKKISTYNQPLTPYTGDYPDRGNTHWLVYWSPTQNGFGITEGGSSGCPIFNSSGLVVGTLTGGLSACNNVPDNMKLDLFGKVSYSWESNGTSDNTKLQPFLDPTNSGVNELYGRNYQESSSLLEVDNEKTPFTIYPNPAKDEVFIDMSMQKHPTTLTIYDIYSREVKKEIIPQNTNSYKLDISTLYSGTFILKFSTNNRNWTKKLIINP